ncbi:hypothetical protein GGR50DRAFT_697282 [Xylaria sp. CBS 124048]|nr:hypothetical protein GGR50DRAFT_697282 [Xylaria sp. CBS 124048]
MHPKRKRSESELSASTTSPLGSPSRFDAVSPPSTDTPMDIDSFSFTPSFTPNFPPPSTLSCSNNQNLIYPRASGRTMKRFRNNRPSEHEVHQRTLNKLYAAQRLLTNAQSQPMPTFGQQKQHAPVATQSGSAASAHQTSLHSFWNLPSYLSASPTKCLLPMLVDMPTECDDCGRKLHSDNEDMMDVDDAPDAQGTSCCACGKHVCSHCSISNLGEQRRCLGCAGTIPPTTRMEGGAGRVSWAQGMTNWLC